VALLSLVLALPAAAQVATDPLLLMIRPVTAATGGTFSDNPASPGITITIPPGALNANALLWVVRKSGQPGAGPDQTVASPAYRVALLPQAGSTRPVLRRAMKVAIRADRAPIHPQVGEIAVRRGARWERLAANFFRPGQGRVVALTTLTDGTLRVVHRSLQAETGPAVAAGRDLFMFETFGNEGFFGGVLGLHDLLNEVPPAAAVGLGVQVDLNRVPQPIVDVLTGNDFAAKQAALQDPAVTRALIKADAVIGVKGFYASQASDRMTSAGITCGLCHVNVTTTRFELSPGNFVDLPIGQPRFDGVPNERLNAGGILALTPTAQSIPGLSALLQTWGPGRFDVRALDLPDVDRNPLEDGINNPTEYPPIWNFVDLSEQGYTIGWDGLFQDNGETNNALASISEAVYDLIFHGNGAFGIPPFVSEGGDGGTIAPELSIAPPQALVDALVQSEAERPGNDVVPPQRLLELQSFMRSIVSPAPGAFNATLAERGFELFHGRAGCSSCHSSPELTGPGLFTDITATPPAGGLAAGIKVPGLRGIARTAPYFHDGSAPTLAAVVNRYVARGQQVPLLSAQERAALVEYLKSL
jgi:hypothetical protein